MGNFSAFMQQYVRPSRWWRRRRTLEITVWPRWLAQLLCPHPKRQMAGFDVEAKTKMSMCLDCHKWLLERNDCAHGEVQVCMMETVGGRLVPRTYRCDHCDVELERKHLPEGVRVSHPGVRSAE